MWFARDSSKSLSKNKQFAWKRYFLMFLTVFPSFIPKELIASIALSSVTLFKDWQDQFALIALYKKSTGSELLPSLFTKEWQWANWSCQYLKKSDGSDLLYFAISITKNERFLQKTNDQIPNLGRKTVNSFHFYFEETENLPW